MFFDIKTAYFYNKHTRIPYTFIPKLKTNFSISFKLPNFNTTSF